MDKPIERQKLIDYKNKLFDQAQEWYDWASINEDECQSKTELALSVKIERIAMDIEEILYP